MGEVADHISGLRAENYPLLVVLGRGVQPRVFFSGMEIGEVVRGMMETLEDSDEITGKDEEEDILAERLLKEEQNKAFEEAVLLDQKKMREQEAAEKVAEDIKTKIQEEIEAAQGRLVEEPGENEDYVMVRMMMEEGQLERRFKRSHKVKNILDWVVSQGVGKDKFQLLFWPDIDIAKVDEEVNIGDIFMENRRVVLMLEMLDMDDS